MHASSQCLHSVDTVYHGALRFITNLKALIHHCSLYARVGCRGVTKYRATKYRDIKTWRYASLRRKTESWYQGIIDTTNILALGLNAASSCCSARPMEGGWVHAISLGYNTCAVKSGLLSLILNQSQRTTAASVTLHMCHTPRAIVGWPALSICRLNHLHVLIYKAILHVYGNLYSVLTESCYAFFMLNDLFPRNLWAHLNRSFKVMLLCDSLWRNSVSQICRLKVQFVGFGGI